MSTAQAEQQKQPTQHGQLAADSVARRMSEVKRATRKYFSAEEKIRIVLESFKKEVSVSELCRKEGINPAAYYAWSKGFLESGKAGLQGATLREATRGEVAGLKNQNARLLELVGRLALENDAFKKSLS